MLFASCILLLGGYTAQAIGLEYTTAARGAFTGTFTVLAVPLLVGFSGRKVPATTWVAAVVALIGIADYELLVPLMPEAAGHAEPVHSPMHTDTVAADTAATDEAVAQLANPGWLYGHCTAFSAEA